LTRDDPEEYGTVYSNTVIKTNTRLFICHHEGNRTTEDATALFSDLEQRRSTDSQIPIFISDEWDPFEEGLLNIYGVQTTPPYKGIGRKPKPITIPPPDLKYVQICKKKEHNTVIGVVRRVVFGDEENVLNSIHTDSNYKISTSYVEGLNRTIRNALARFIRRGMNFSKQMEMHVRALDFFQAWYNFVKPHESLRVEINQGNTRWKKRTPAMAEGLVDHIFTLEELLTFRVPVQ